MNRRVTLYVGSWIAATVLCVLWVDRAAASWSHQHLKGYFLFDPLTHLVDPLLPAAVVGLAILGAARLSTGWRPGEGGRTVLAFCLAIVIAVALKEQLKVAFGRTWPETWVANNPSWISNRAFGFHPFHGGAGWTSFPSGHMTQMSAFAAVFWRRVRRLRWLAPVPLVLVGVGLLGANYHYVGDMVAGTFLGTATALGVLAFLKDGSVTSHAHGQDARVPVAGPAAQPKM